MNALFVGFGAVALLAYGIVSFRERNLLNAISPFFAFYFVTSFILEPIYFNTREDFSYDIEAFFIVYLTDLSYFCGLALVYQVKARYDFTNGVQRVCKASSNGTNFGPSSWTWLLASAAIFAPVAIRFVDYILTDPRRLYELTRSAYGQYLFISSLFLNLGVICFLFSSRRRAWLFVPCVIILSLMKGAKGPILVLVEICILWLVYVRGWKLGLMKLVFLGSLVTCTMLALFAFTLRGISTAELGEAIADYSDYNRHASLTVTDPIGPFFGRLELESFFYSRVPRILFPDKPKDFGAFLLAEHYLPDAFAADSGSPAFGAGILIADFGAFAPMLSLLFGACSGYLLGFCLNWLKQGGGVAAFTPFLYFANVSLIPIPTAYLGIEHFFLGWLLQVFSRFRFFPRDSLARKK